MAKWSATKGKNLAHRIKLKTGTTRKIPSGKVSCECCFGIAKKYNKNIKHLKNRRNRRRSPKKCDATFISHFVLIWPVPLSELHPTCQMQCNVKDKVDLVDTIMATKRILVETNLAPTSAFSRIWSDVLGWNLHLDHDVRKEFRRLKWFAHQVSWNEMDTLWQRIGVFAP